MEYHRPQKPHFSIIVSPSQFPPIGIAISHLFNQNHKARYFEHTVKLDNGTPHQNHALALAFLADIP